MDIKLLDSLTLLKEAIENDPRVKKLNELEERINNDETVMGLSYKKDNASREYEDALRFFKDGSEEVKKAQQALYKAKYELDTNPLVKEYSKAYKEVRLLYDELNNMLFKDFKGKGHICD